MKRKPYVGKKMYAIFTGIKGNGKEYVQPCNVISVDKNGFWADCHNGGEYGIGKGLEYFKNSNIGISVFFSKDSAELKLKK